MRYYYMHRGPFNLYLDGGMGFNHSKPEQNTATKRNGYEIGIRPGVCVDLAKGFCLCMRMGFVGYRNNYFVGEEHEVGDNGFGLRFARGGRRALFRPRRGKPEAVCGKGEDFAD